MVSAEGYICQSILSISPVNLSICIYTAKTSSAEDTNIPGMFATGRNNIIILKGGGVLIYVYR